MSIQAIVDDREQRSGLPRALSANEGVLVTVQRLRLGDVLMDGRLLFERKTVMDFAVSLADGRLLRQAAALARDPRQAALVLEGQPPRRLPVSRSAVQGAMVSVTLIWGLPVLRTGDVNETARVMLYAARQARRAGRGLRPSAGSIERLSPARRQRIRFLMGLPSVGPRRAERLLNRFGSVENVLLADEEELVAVRGISYGTARAIRGLVRETRSAYHI